MAEHGQARRGIERALYGVDDSRYSCSLIDHVRVCPADHQDVADRLRQGCERIDDSSIYLRGGVMDVVRDTPPGSHHYLCQCHIIGDCLDCRRIVSEAQSRQAAQEGLRGEKAGGGAFPSLRRGIFGRGNLSAASTIFASLASAAASGCLRLETDFLGINLLL